MHVNSRNDHKQDIKYGVLFRKSCEMEFEGEKKVAEGSMGLYKVLE